MRLVQKTGRMQILDRRHGPGTRPHRFVPSQPTHANGLGVALRAAVSPAEPPRIRCVTEGACLEVPGWNLAAIGRGIEAPIRYSGSIPHPQDLRLLLTAFARREYSPTSGKQLRDIDNLQNKLITGFILRVHSIPIVIPSAMHNI